VSRLTDVVWRGLEAMNAGDAEAFVAISHPDIEFIPRRAPVQGAFHGHAGLRAFFADTAQNFDAFEVSLDEVREAPGDRVVATGTLRIRGKGSGAEVTVPTAVVIDFEAEKVVRFEELGDRDRALAAAGLDR
jgi:ketosteroid isomerase-like protein